MTPTASLPTSAEPPAVRRLINQLGIDSAYLLTGFPIALAGFVVFVTGFSLGVGMFITLAGIPILTATLFAARGFAELERWRISRVLDVPHVGGTYKRAARDAGVWRRLFAPIADGQSWLDLLHGVIGFIVATVTWSIAVGWWAAAVGGTLTVVYDWTIPHPPHKVDSLNELLGMGDSTTARVTLYTAIGLFFLLTLPIVTRLCAQLQASIAKALLTGMTDLRARIAGLERANAAAEAATATARSQRSAAVSAESTALRRLERDIHDGPQQRLVRLAMDLGRAEHQLDTDPEAARRTVAEALLQTRETLDELRALSRGIAPPILVDRGLVAAVAALAGRSTVPVELDAPDPGRLDPSVESTAYFVLAEALTNVAKHSRADECQAIVRRDNDHLLVSVVDNGVGGAELSKGHGLAGLADRVHAAGGELTLTSPPGGPTVVSARLPCQ
ncbi:sensor histidine kinase [Planosporangium thailandense]|uniref:histidine kinase n=1 Tax=Planosporangium thailandense TaxID=765197 RepID=A0ABX0XVH6_9ACTN|nr:sensor histidine kinase [Planosporangium thailandense]NJC69327.1 sensor histidine kinase [Planosporangium thailandense]